MLAVGSRNDAALAVIATATASGPAGRRCWPAARNATGMATTTATSRLISPLSSAVKVSTEAAATVRDASSLISTRARARNAPNRPASAEVAMIAAKVANGVKVARAAASRAWTRQQAAAV